MNYLIPRCELEDPRHIPYVESPFMAACHVTLYVNGCFTHDLVRCPVNILPIKARLRAHGGVANPRHRSGYGEDLRLAVNTNASL